MSVINALFKGALPNELRRALGSYVAGRSFDKVIIPFTGRFAAAEVIAGGVAGFKPEMLVTSDIGLYSSVIGYYLSGKNIDELGIRINDIALETIVAKADEGVQRVASILLSIKVGQLIKRKPFYYQSAAKEVMRHHPLYIEKMAHTLTEQHKAIGGLEYRIKDAFKELEEWKNREDVFIYMNPPAFEGGYTKMFKIPNTLTWNEPPITEFSGDMFETLIKEADDSPATIVIVAHKNKDVNQLEVLPPKWLPIHGKAADQHSAGKEVYLIANKEIDSRVSRRIDKPLTMNFEIFNDNDITKYTKVEIMPISREQTTYYRDLWVHKLGVTGADICAAMLLDGKIFNVFGLGTRATRQGAVDYIFEMFGITVPSKRYLRLGRLFMRLLMSADFKKWLLRENKGFELWDIKGIKTVCITRQEKNRLIEGLWKKQSKKKQPNGTWFLEYYTDFSDKTARQMIIEWLDEENHLASARAKLKVVEEKEDE